MVAFDDEVARLRSLGIQPKCTRKLKQHCTPEEWAAHREYMRLRYSDPRCREMHRINQITHLIKKR